MGTAVNFDPFLSTARRAVSKQLVRYAFFYSIGIYLISDFWNQMLQYEGHTHASAVFTLSSGSIVAVTSVVDWIESSGMRNTANEQLESFFIGVYALLIIGLGMRKLKDGRRSNKPMPDVELFGILGSFTIAFVFIFVLVTLTN